MQPAVLAALDTPLPAYTPSQVAQVAEQSGTELVNTDGMPPIAVQPTAQIFTDCLKAANARREAQRQAIYAIRYCEECSFCDNSTANPTASDIFNNWCGFIHLCPQGCICVACIEAEYYRDIACNAKDCKSASKCACSVCVCCTSVLLVPVPYFIGLALSPAVCICAHFYTLSYVMIVHIE
jgi:hypothetical protein